MRNKPIEFEKIMSTYTIKALALSITLFAGGCAMNETGERTGAGAAIGALGGAVLGGSRESAVIGAAVGATGGYIYDQQKKKETSTADNEQLRQENERLRLEAENQQLRGQTGQ
jgi:osmotically inducible lipoprotein OsmB